MIRGLKTRSLGRDHTPDEACAKDAGGHLSQHIGITDRAQIRRVSNGIQQLLKLALTTAGEAYAIPPYLSHSRAGSRGGDDSTAAILPAADGVRDGRDAALSSGAALVTPIKSSRGGGADSKATGDASDSETHESFELRGTSTRGAAT